MGCLLGILGLLLPPPQKKPYQIHTHKDSSRHTLKNRTSWAAMLARRVRSCPLLRQIFQYNFLKNEPFPLSLSWRTEERIQLLREPWERRWSTQGSPMAAFSQSFRFSTTRLWTAPSSPMQAHCVAKRKGKLWNKLGGLWVGGWDTRSLKTPTGPFRKPSPPQKS